MRVCASIPDAPGSPSAPAGPGWARAAPASARLAERRAVRTVQVRRVLVVDDDPDILSTLVSTLEELLDVPVEVATAASGDEAKDRIGRGERFDMVITDERMPGLRGSQLLDWLRAEQPGTVRVLMSAYYQGYAARDLQTSAGADAFVEKPFRVDRMLADLRRLLAERED